MAASVEFRSGEAWCSLQAVDKMTREQMLAEFGAPGVQNPTIVDLITVDATSDAVVLVMIERRGWGTAAPQLKQIEEKVNRYMAYALDGFLVEHYPRHAGKRVQIRLDCAEPPHGEAVKFVQSMAHAIEAHGLGFSIRVLPAVE
jgi:hypothetical protein